MALKDRATLEQAVVEATAREISGDTRELLKWAYDLLGDNLMMSTAFGKSGMVLLHFVKDLIPGLPIYFLDTGFHFQETIDYANLLKRDWGLNLHFHRPKLYGDSFKEKYGEKLYETNPDLCCHKNKVEPFAELLDQHQGWIAGIRRDQSASRAEAEALEVLETNKLKIQPLVMWTRSRVEDYIADHDIPLHPLFSKGYRSIGCAPCTQAVTGDDERAGRWAGKEKTECGLHLFWKGKEDEEAPPKGGESPDSQAFSA